MTQHFLHRARSSRILRPAPGIALVVDETLRHAERERLAVRALASDLAQHRRNVGETVLGQISAHLRFRVRAGVNAPEQLDHDLAADDQRAVGLFDRRTPHRRVGPDLQ